MTTSTTTGVCMYFLTIKIVPQKEGNNILQFIRKISNFLADKDEEVKFTHKYKVFCEATIMAFAQVTNTTELERITVSIMKLGHVVIDSQQVISYESYARSIKVAEELCAKSENILQKEGLYLLEFCVECHGQNSEDCERYQKKQAEYILTKQQNGEIKIELFKSLCERRVYMLTNSTEPEKLDQTVMALLNMFDNGKNILAKAKAMQLLDDYNKLKL